MFVIKKLYTNSQINGTHYVLKEEEAIKSVHALTNSEFYKRIHEYIGWTVINFTHENVNNFLIEEEEPLLVAHYDLKHTVSSIKFTPIAQYFEGGENIIDGTIRAVGTIDSEGIIDSKRYEPKVTNGYNKISELKEVSYKIFEKPVSNILPKPTIPEQILDLISPKN